MFDIARSETVMLFLKLLLDMRGNYLIFAERMAAMAKTGHVLKPRELGMVLVLTGIPDHEALREYIESRVFDRDRYPHGIALLESLTESDFPRWDAALERAA